MYACMVGGKADESDSDSDQDEHRRSWNCCTVLYFTVHRLVSRNLCSTDLDSAAKNIMLRHVRSWYRRRCIF